MMPWVYFSISLSKDFFSFIHLLNKYWLRVLLDLGDWAANNTDKNPSSGEA